MRPFVKNKSFKDLSSRFSLRVNKDWRINVFIYNSDKGVQRNTNFPKGKTVGAYVADPKRHTHNIWGELHLALPRIGSGYIAHEIAHVIYDWFGVGYQDKVDNEEQAWLTGELVRKFWIKFYRRYRGSK